MSARQYAKILAKKAAYKAHPGVGTVARTQAAYANARSSRTARAQAARGQNQRYVGSIPLNRLQEHKTFDSVATVTTIANCFSTSGSVAGTPFAPVAATSAWCLNQVPLGNSSITRVGRRFANTAIALRGKVYAGSTGTHSIASLVLVWDRNPNNGAAIPAFSSVLSSQEAKSLTNKDNAPRFKILRRWTWEVAGNLTAGQITDKGVYYFDEFVKMKNKVTLLTAADTTGLLPDMVEGSLLLYAVGDTAAGTACPSLDIQTRLYFSDH